MQTDKMRNYLNELYKGRRTKCRDCKKEGTIGITLEVECSDFIGPGTLEQSIWAFCQDCREKAMKNNR